MEPASFAVAVATLPQIFTACLECFCTVRLGRRFGADYGACQARLEAARLRLLRWGEPMGLLDADFDATALFERGAGGNGNANGSNMWKADEVAQATRWLGLILTQFNQAQARADEYRVVIARSPADVEVIEDLDDSPNTASNGPAGSPTNGLIRYTRALATHRQRHLPLHKKAAWALYRKSEFESLIESLTALTRNLVELFPFATRQRQEELAGQEAAGLPEEGVRPLVAALNADSDGEDGGEDDVLSRAVAAEVRRRQDQDENGGHVFEDVVFDGRGFARLGDTLETSEGRQVGGKGMRFKGIRISGEGEFHGGHYLKGPAAGAEAR